MKKTLLLALILTLGMLLCAAPACADISADVEAGQAMTREELAEKAMAESGTFVVYGNTSRIATAAEDFAAIYGISVESNNLKDQEIYTKLRSENGRGAADMVMIQDGAQLSDAIDEGLRFPSSLQNFLIDTGDEVILVDTGMPKETPDTPPNDKTQVYIGTRVRDYVSALEDLGYKPEQVTKILVHKLTFHSTVVCIAAEGATGDVALKKADDALRRLYIVFFRGFYDFVRDRFHSATPINSWIRFSAAILRRCAALLEIWSTEPSSASLSPIM